MMNEERDGSSIVDVKNMKEIERGKAKIKAKSKNGSTNSTKNLEHKTCVLFVLFSTMVLSST